MQIFQQQENSEYCKMNEDWKTHLIKQNIYTFYTGSGNSRCGALCISSDPAVHVDEGILVQNILFRRIVLKCLTLLPYNNIYFESLCT